MSLEALAAWADSRRSVRPVSLVTADEPVAVTPECPSLLGCTAVTAVTRKAPCIAMQRVEDACNRQSLPVGPVLAQFDHWRYSAADLGEIEAWGASTVEAHARLLLFEASEAGVSAKAFSGC